MKSEDVSYLTKNKIGKGAIQITSPFTGTVMAMEEHPEPFFRFGTLGPGVIVSLSSHKILAPFNGVLLQAKSGGCEFILKANNGLKVLINLAVPNSQTLMHTHIAQLSDSKITKGQRLAYFDLRELDSPILASLIILNGHNVGTFHYSHPHVNAGVDTLLTIIKKK